MSVAKESSPNARTWSPSLEGCARCLRRAQSDLVLAVDVQHTNGCAANSGLTVDVDASPFEMIFPPLASWVKERDDLIRLRIDPGQIGALVQIAINTSETKIVRIIGSSMFLGDDVLDVEFCKRGVILV